MKRSLKGDIKEEKSVKTSKLSKIGEFIKNGKPLVVVYDAKAVNK